MNASFRTLRLAAALSVLTATAAPAAIIAFFNEDIPIATTFAGTSVDLETGAVGSASGADANFFFGGTGVSNDADPTASAPTWQPVRTGTGNLDPIANLLFGATVDASSSFSTGYGGSSSHLGDTFTSGVPGYIGYSLDSGSGPNYGWMLVTLQPNTSEGIIHFWAFEDSGAAIMVGAVPEPSTALLALLALSCLLFRRRP